jgi:uncharacterized protein involved in exopolysaccharide biosynthesis
VNAGSEFRGEPQGLSLAEVLACIWQGRVLMVTSVAICALAFGAAAFLMTPMYRAATLLAPTITDQPGALSSALSSVSGIASLAGINLGSSGPAQKEQALAVLQSREFTEKFIADLQLMPEFYADKWDIQSKAWKVPLGKQPTLAQAYRYFAKLRAAAEDKKTGLVTIEVEWKDPQKAAFWVNELVARLNSVMRTRAIERTDAYIQYLEKELTSTSAIETRNAIDRLMESQINQRMLANVTEEYAFQVVDKALPPEADEPIRPRKLMLVLLGGLLGLAIGTVAVFVSKLVQVHEAEE